MLSEYVKRIVDVSIYYGVTAKVLVLVLNFLFCKFLHH